MVKIRTYIVEAILEAAPDDECFLSRDIKDDVSKIVGKETSSHKIGQYLSYLHSKGLVGKEELRNSTHLWWKICRNMKY